MSHDTIIHRAVRPAMRVVAKTPITPNHLTLLRFITGVLAALCFASERIVVGSLIFLFSAFLDRADGELARQTQKFSEHGHRYDLIADWSAGALAFIGLGIGASNGVLGTAALVLGVLAGIGVTVLFWGINLRQIYTLPREPGRRVLVDPDDGMFLVPPLLWCAGAESVLLLAGSVTPLLAATMLWLLWRSRGTGTRYAPADRAGNSITRQ